jgi:hypothetical protein
VLQAGAEAGAERWPGRAGGVVAGARRERWPGRSAVERLGSSMARVVAGGVDWQVAEWWRRRRSGGGAGGAVAGRVRGGAVAAPSIGWATATLAAGAPLRVASIAKIAKCVHWGRRRKGGGVIYPLDVYACVCSCRQCWASKCRGL